MRKSKIKLSRLYLLLALTLTSLAGNCPPSSPPTFFPAFTPVPSLVSPPTDDLLLWLEGNAGGAGSYMRVDASNAVLQWHDVRGGSQGISAVGLLTGQMITVPLTTPAGHSYNAFALRCGDPTHSDVRCSYLATSPATTRGSLDGTPYTILAVVRRTSAQGDNFFLMTNGSGCNPPLGGGLCAANSALHLGWVREKEVRLGQWANDVTLEPSPAFDSSALPLSLFVAVSAPDEGKTVALLEPTFNSFKTVTDTTPLTNSRDLYIGGTAWGIGQDQPNWRFVGDIFAILIYRKRLTTGEMRDAQNYLRFAYGPG